VIDRRSTAYGSALTLIDLLLNGMGISMTEAANPVQLPGFLFDMNSFFQSLISRFLHEELSDFSLQDEHRLKGIFEYDPANNPKRHRAVFPRPDFAVLAHGKVVEFLDAKYRDLWETSLPLPVCTQECIEAARNSSMISTRASRFASSLSRSYLGAFLYVGRCRFGPGGQSDRRRNKWHDFVNYR
jgi:5-methylcytosine-specific restriction enzyme subunit McrC